jgi:hypothetical protein
MEGIDVGDGTGVAVSVAVGVGEAGTAVGDGVNGVAEGVAGVAEAGGGVTVGGAQAASSASRQYINKSEYLHLAIMGSFYPIPQTHSTFPGALTRYDYRFRILCITEFSNIDTTLRSIL